MGLFKKILGISDTKTPADTAAWKVGGQRVTLDLSRLPELKKNGGAVRLEGKGLPRRLFVIRGKNDEFHAFENRCTHMGRRLDPGSRPGTIKCCSVSGSVFDLSGKPVAGAAKHPVNTFSVLQNDDVLEIDLEKAQ